MKTIEEIVAEIREDARLYRAAREFDVHYSVVWRGSLLDVMLAGIANAIEQASKVKDEQFAKRLAECSEERDRYKRMYEELATPDPDWKEICAKCNEGEIEPKECVYYGEPNGCNSPIYGEHPQAEQYNAAAMREALVLVKIKLADWGFTTRHDAPPSGSLSYDCARLMEVVNAALSAPLRNCDVGTAGEQYQRFCDYCYSNRCVSLVTPNTLGSEVAFNWAQMPYNSETK